MTTTTAFLAQVTATKYWDIYHVDLGSGIEEGYKFQVLGDGPDDICEVLLLDRKGNKTGVSFTPNDGTLVIESSAENVLTIHFMFGEGPKVKAFFLRFFFFCEDPTLFRYKIKGVDQDYNRDGKHICCSPIDLLYPSKAKSNTRALNSMMPLADDDEMGTGGPRLV